MNCATCGMVNAHIEACQTPTCLSGRIVGHGASAPRDPLLGRRKQPTRSRHVTGNALNIPTGLPDSPSGRPFFFAGVACSANPRAAKRQRRRRAANATRQLRLIGPTAMVHAIGEAGVHLFTAEMEIGFAGMSHRPAAYAVGEVEQVGLVGNFRAGPRRHAAPGRGWRDRGLLIARTLAQKAARSIGNNSRHGLSTAGQGLAVDAGRGGRRSCVHLASSSARCEWCSAPTRRTAGD